MSATTQTSLVVGDQIKNQIIGLLEQYLLDEEYCTKSNEEDLNRIQSHKTLLDQFKAFRPQAYVLVSGGMIQGAHANCSLAIEVFDEDCTCTGSTEDDEAYIESHGTIDEWSKSLAIGESDNILKPVL